MSTASGSSRRNSKRWKSKILGAEERLGALEYELFVALRDTVAAECVRIQKAAEAVALLDVFVSFAQVAAENNYCRPVLSEGADLVIREGRHPVVERMVPGGSFVPNDTEIIKKESQILLITGPNMAGKSTYLRQNALICIMAQIGSFVPASFAQIGIVDKFFTRVGAADRLARGLSTFLVEMIEVANILNNATDRSLVLLDEVGRGTSTFDGISIAWAVAEYLHETAEPAQPYPFCDPLPRAHRNGAPVPAHKKFTYKSQGVERPDHLPAQDRSWFAATTPTASRWRASPACRAR